MPAWTKYTVPGSLVAIVEGPDGNLWAPDDSTTVLKITPSGGYTAYTAGATSPDVPVTIVVGSDGNLWTPNNTGMRRITTAGVVTAFGSFGATTNGPVAAGPDGNLWTQFLVSGSLPIERFTTAGVRTSFSSPSSFPMYGISTNGTNLYLVTDLGQFYLLTTAGVHTLLNSNIGNAGQLCFDGTNFWCAGGGGSVTKITVAGVATSYTISSGAQLDSICFDGTNLWAGDAVTGNGLWEIPPASPTSAAVYPLAGASITGVCTGPGGIWACDANNAVWGPGSAYSNQIVMIL
jgi:hypothetical protein